MASIFGKDFNAEEFSEKVSSQVYKVVKKAEDVANETAKGIEDAFGTNKSSPPPGGYNNYAQNNYTQSNYNQNQPPYNPPGGYRQPGSPYDQRWSNNAGSPPITPPPPRNYGCAPQYTNSNTVYPTSYKKAPVAPVKQVRKKDTLVVPEGMRAVRRKSAVPFYMAGGAAVAYMCFLPVYNVWQMVLALAVTGLVWFGSSKLFRGKMVLVPIKEKPVKEPEPLTTGNEDVDRMISDGAEYIRKLREANDAIEDETISDNITAMETTTKKIFEFVSENPKKAPQIRKFMNYYLPTTLKLLNSYDRLSRQGVKGENISSTMFNIEGMMHTIVMAFEKQLDALFQDEALDISTDITVMESMLEQEGFIKGGNNDNG